MKNNKILILFTCFCFSLFACNLFDEEPRQPYTTFITTVGGNGYDVAWDIIENEEGYVMVGAIGPQCDIVDAFMALLDKQSGATINLNTFGNPNQGVEENFFSLAFVQNRLMAVGFSLDKLPPAPGALFCGNPNEDGQVFVGSVSQNFTRDTSYYLDFDSLSYDNGLQIKEGPNGEILITGGWEGFVAVLELKGDTVSRVIRSDNLIGNGFKMLMHSNGRVFLTGELYNPFGGFFFAEVDLANNRMVNERIFSYASDGWPRALAYAIEEAPDGNILLAGVLGTFNYDDDNMFFMKLDQNGNELLFKNISVGVNDAVHDMIPFEDGYAITGKISPDGSPAGSDALVAKIDPEGNFLWMEHHDLRENTEWGLSILHTTDGGLLVTGGTQNNEKGIRSILLLKTDAEGRIEEQ